MTDAELLEELELCAVELLRGQAYGPLLVGQLGRGAERVLARHGVRGRVHVLEGGRRVVVERIEGPRVRQLVLRVDAG